MQVHLYGQHSRHSLPQMILSCPSVTMKVYGAGVLEGFKAFIEEAFCLDVMYKAMLFFP